MKHGETISQKNSNASHLYKHKLYLLLQYLKQVNGSGIIRLTFQVKNMFDDDILNLYIGQKVQPITYPKTFVVTPVFEKNIKSIITKLSI